MSDLNQLQKSLDDAVSRGIITREQAINTYDLEVKSNRVREQLKLDTKRDGDLK